MTQEYKTMIVGGVAYQIPKFNSSVDDCKTHTPVDVYLFQAINSIEWFARCSNCGNDYHLKNESAILALKSGTPYRGQEKEFPDQIFNHINSSLESKFSEKEL